MANDENRETFISNTQCAGKMTDKLIDSHCHLYMLSDKEIEKAIAESAKAGVTKIVSNSTSFQSNQYNLRISKTFPNVKSALGLYPLDALELSDEELERAFGFITKHLNEAVAVGEVGMDYKYAKTDDEKKKQGEIFRRFIQLAKKNNKPIIVHSRYAQSQVLKILEEEKAQKVLLHSFVDSSKLMKKAVDNGFFISVGMVVTENAEVQARIEEFPAENLLFETDCPMLFSGNKTMPKDIIKIASKIAELKRIPLEKLVKQQEINFKSLFGEL